MSAEPINLTLPWPPATNNLYATIIVKGRPIRIPSKQSKQFKADVLRICQAARIQPFVGEVSVSMKVYRPRRVGDLDGIFKSTLDSLTGSAWLDDRQVAEIHAKRFEDKFSPRVEIEIKPVGIL